MAMVAPAHVSRRRAYDLRCAAVTGLIAVAVLVHAARAATAQSARAVEYQVKAAFLYNFAKFVDWPEDAFQNSGDTFVICVLGEDPFGPTLDVALASKTVHDKRLVARRLERPEDALPCHMLFISSSEEQRLPQILQTLAGASVLTVGELLTFTPLGGMIRFKMEGNKVRFEINLDAAQQARLQISSQILTLATHVITGSLGGTGAPD